MAAEHEYRALVDAMDLGFCVCEILLDSQGRPSDYRFLDVNRLFEEQTGLRNAAGRTALELIPDLERSWVDTYGRVALTQTPVRFEQDSAVMGRWFSVHAFPIPPAAAHTIGILFSDITARRAADEKLRRTQARLESALRAGVAGTFYLDIASGLLTTDENMMRYFSLAPDALDGGVPIATVLEAIHPDDLARVERALDDASRGSGVYAVEYRVRHADGRVRWLLARGVADRDGDGHIIGLPGFAVDTTERKEAEEALIHAGQMKDEFLATVSHELRTPVHAVLGWAHMLRSGSLSAQGAARALETLERNALAQRQLVDDLLDMSRIVSGKLRMNLTPVDIRSIVASAIETMRPLAETKEIALEVTSGGQAIDVDGDADRLRQAVLNLLSNAVKFTPRGGRVNVSARLDGDAALIEVRDTGEGIDAAFLPHVFDRFRQANPEARAGHDGHTGLGLGLAVVRYMVEAHGGSVHAASEGSGHGATFAIRLPLASRTAG